MTVSLKNHRRLAYFIRLQHRYLRAFNFTQNVKWTVVNIHSPSQCTALASKFDLFTRFACGQIFQQPVWGKYWWTALTKKQMFQEDEWATTPVTNNNIGAACPCGPARAAIHGNCPCQFIYQPPRAWKQQSFSNTPNGWLNVCLSRESWGWGEGIWNLAQESFSVCVCSPFAQDKWSRETAWNCFRQDSKNLLLIKRDWFPRPASFPHLTTGPRRGVSDCRFISGLTQSSVHFIVEWLIASTYIWMNIAGILRQCI
jgi:hypothetical protein